MAPGSSYTLPYPININGNSNQWLGVNGAGGAPANNDLVNWTNPGGSSAPGLLTIYSNPNPSNNDPSGGGLALVSSSAWSTLLTEATPIGYSTVEAGTPLTAFYSTYGDTSGVPGDPKPHPSIEANYYINVAGVVPVPEPGSLALLGSSAVALAGFVWRRAEAALPERENTLTETLPEGPPRGGPSFFCGSFRCLGILAVGRRLVFGKLAVPLANCLLQNVLDLAVHAAQFLLRPTLQGLVKGGTDAEQK